MELVVRSRSQREQTQDVDDDPDRPALSRMYRLPVKVGCRPVLHGERGGTEGHRGIPEEAGVVANTEGPAEDGLAGAVQAHGDLLLLSDLTGGVRQ